MARKEIKQSVETDSTAAPLEPAVDVLKIVPGSTVSSEEVTPVTADPKPENKSELAQIYAIARDIPLQSVSPNESPDIVSEEQAVVFLDTLAGSLEITREKALIGSSILFLRGACNSSAPQEMSAEVTADNGEKVQITKFDIQYACHQATGNIHIRRMAQALAPYVCDYAEKYGLMGDLAPRLNNLALSKGEAPLSFKERAWANSFCQNVPDLEAKASPRLPILLATDYSSRFQKKGQGKGKNQKEKDSSTRDWRAGKPQKPKKENATGGSERKSGGSFRADPGPKRKSLFEKKEE